MAVSSTPSTVSMQVQMINPQGNPCDPSNYQQTFYLQATNGPQVITDFTDANQVGEIEEIQFYMANSGDWEISGIGGYIGIPGANTPNVTVSAVLTVGSSNYQNYNITIPTHFYWRFLIDTNILSNLMGIQLSDASLNTGEITFFFQYYSPSLQMTLQFDPPIKNQET
jgi:hypothetical protein